MEIVRLDAGPIEDSTPAREGRIIDRAAAGP